MNSSSSNRRWLPAIAVLLVPMLVGSGSAATAENGPASSGTLTSESGNPRIDPIIRHPRSDKEKKKRERKEKAVPQDARVPAGGGEASDERERVSRQVSGPSGPTRMESWYERHAREVARRVPEGGSAGSRGSVVRRSVFQDYGNARVRAAYALVQASPNQAGPWIEFGNALARVNEPKDAQRAYREALRVDPDSSVAWNNICGVHLSEYEDEQALEACKRAISADRRNALAYYNTGIAYDRLGKLDPALDHYQRAFVLDRSLKDPKVNPNIVNNRHMQVLKLRLYQDQGGSLSLPLQREE